MMHIDLHIHSSLSDGSESVDTIVARAKENGLKVISITDHDTCAAYATIDNYTDDLIVIKGIELSCQDNTHHKNIHILGYYLNTATPHIDALCEPMLAKRKEITLWQIAQLQKYGYEITVDEVLALAPSSTSLYKQHIMDILTSKGYSSSLYSSTYKQLFKNGGICACDMEYADMNDAIEAIHKDGGLAILAHPYLSGVEAYIGAYVNCGMDGIESYHSSHTIQQIEKLNEIAKEYQLIETGGSDYHGYYGNEPDIGDYNPFFQKENIVV